MPAVKPRRLARRNRLESAKAALTGRNRRRSSRTTRIVLPVAPGDKSFRKELLSQIQERRGPEHYGEERFESDEAKALSILQQELKRRGWTEEELKARRKGDKRKVAIAARLRKETTMTLKWIAERLAMGSWNNVSNLLAASRKRKQE